MKKLFLISLSLFMSVAVSMADTYTDDNGITWTFNVEEGNVSITGAEGCGETVVVPSMIDSKTVTKLEGTFYGNTTIKNVTVPTTVTSIGKNSFRACSRLLQVDGLTNCTRIGGYAFLECNKLTSISNLGSLTSMGSSAFSDCFELNVTINLNTLTSISNNAFRNCSKMSFIGNFENCTSIGDYAFEGCWSFTDVKIESDVLETIGYNAFYCAHSVEIKAPYLSSIEDGAFYWANLFSINTETPPSLKGSVFTSNRITILVPAALVDTYKNAEGWSDYASNILSDETQINYDINVSALDNSSTIHAKIGESNLANVVSLKVTGTINGYDFNILRNKMPNLHYLDLENVSILANDYKYYSDYTSKDNELGCYVFRAKNSLYSVKLPKTITTIGEGAFQSCFNLRTVTMYRGILEIQSYAFDCCTGLLEILFPPTVQRINAYSFRGCYCLSEIRIPSSVQSIYWYSFESCSSIKDVYTYTIEPTSLGSNVFDSGVYNNATLHVPSTSYYNYYWETGWNQFQTMVPFDDPYEYFYLNNDYTLDENNGRINGDPDADLNPGSGLIVEGNDDQDLDDVHMKEDDDSGSSIIGDGNINANGLYIDITIKKNQWYFLSFPYRIKLADIVCEGSYTFRLYDGEERANNGYGGWKHLPEAAEYLEPGQGYIFRCNQNTTLQIPVEKTQYGKFAGGDRQQDMTAHAAEGRSEDASWNFLGNPYPCYYDIDNTGYNGPITVWDGEKYETYRPGDDAYHLRPFEAFFVQKPSDQATLEYNKDGRHTYNQWDGILEQKNQARQMARGAVKTRFLINLVLSDGTNTDKTRVVFNEKCSADYEIGTDASKFMATDKPQLYTLDARQVHYAINERPEGEVRLGYVATQAGEMTISAKRLDKAVVLYDTEANMQIDLSSSDYTFMTEAGTFNQRFILKVGGTTGITNTLTDVSAEKAPVYTLDGVRVDKINTRQIYIQDGKKKISK